MAYLISRNAAPAGERRIAGSKLSDREAAANAERIAQGLEPKPPRSHATSIDADLGENAAWNAALQAGEVGLMAPSGPNTTGPDTVTAVVHDDRWWIVYTDVGTPSTPGSPYRKAQPVPNPDWEAEAASYAANCDCGDAEIDRGIAEAAEAGRLLPRSAVVDRRPAPEGDAVPDFMGWDVAEAAARWEAAQAAPGPTVIERPAGPPPSVGGSPTGPGGGTPPIVGPPAG
jgi:hypothetical protein